MDEGRRNLLIFAGAFAAAGIIMATLVFPFWNLIREDVYESAVIISNDEGTCYVETKDTIPKTITGCDAVPGQSVDIVYGKGLAWARITGP